MKLKTILREVVELVLDAACATGSVLLMPPKFRSLQTWRHSFIAHQSFRNAFDETYTKGINS